MFLVAGVFQFTQSKAQKGFSLSVKAIPQFSFLHNSDDNDNNRLDTKTTFKAGFGIGSAYNFNDKIGIGLDVLYSLQGQKYDTASGEINKKLSYLKLPVLFSYNTDPSKTVSFIGKVGPQLSILTTAKLEDGEGEKLVAEGKDVYKNVTWGGVASAGAQFKLSQRFYLGTSVRFDYDFSNAEDEKYRYYSQGRATTHNMTAGLETSLKYVL